jgi:hypothetical protein
VTISQLYTPGVRRVLELDTRGLPMVVWMGQDRPPSKDRAIAAHLAHLLNGTLIIDNDALEGLADGA